MQGQRGARWSPLLRLLLLLLELLLLLLLRREERGCWLKHGDCGRGGGQKWREPIAGGA